MAAREAFLASDDKGDSLDSVEALIKKHEDFDKAINVQEEKIAALQSFADQLVGADHYAKPEIFNRRNEVLDRSVFLFLMTVCVTLWASLCVIVCLFVVAPILSVCPPGL